jgi:hypothetical protein
LTPVCIRGQQRAVDVELKELFLISANCGWKGGGNDRRPQISPWLRGLCMAPNEELVVNVRGVEGVKSEAWIAPKVGAFG